MDGLCKKDAYLAKLSQWAIWRENTMILSEKFYATQVKHEYICQDIFVFLDSIDFVALLGAYEPYLQLYRRLLKYQHLC